MEFLVKHFEEMSGREVYDVLRARSDVFILEQQCLYMDIDGKDIDAYHVLCRGNEGLLACARVMRGEEAGEAVIGRVLTLRRGAGLGRELMLRCIRTAGSIPGAAFIRKEAQAYARGFYEKLGFIVTSEEFLEDGIPHVEMRFYNLQEYRV